MERFKELVAKAPLEPILTDEEYAARCEVQAELINLGRDRDPITDLYLDALTLFIHAYDSAIQETA